MLAVAESVGCVQRARNGILPVGPRSLYSVGHRGDLVEVLRAGRKPGVSVRRSGMDTTDVIPVRAAVPPNETVAVGVRHRGPTDLDGSPALRRSP